MLKLDLQSALKRLGKEIDLLILILWFNITKLNSGLVRISSCKLKFVD